MRILIITTQDKFFLSHIKERAVYFKEQGCIVGVAAQRTSSKYENEIKKLGFSFFDTKIKRASLNPLTQLLALIRLFKIQFSFKPDVSYHLGAKAIFYGTFVSRLFNPNVGIINAPIGLGYVFASNTLKAKMLRPFVFLMYKFFLNPSNSKVIVENFDDIRFFITNGILKQKDAFCILGAGVDTNHFSPIPFSEKNKICTVVMAARLIREKGVFDFVEAANKLSRSCIPVRMQLIGSPDFGNPSSLTPKEYEELRKNPAVECLGYQEDISKFLQMAHICCLPSYYREGLPKILIEAASSGLAIITTDTVGCREIVREQNGFLIPPHDLNKLTQAISYLVTNQEELRQMSKRSRYAALTYFDSRIICKRTFEIIKTLVID